MVEKASGLLCCPKPKGPPAEVMPPMLGVVAVTVEEGEVVVDGVVVDVVLLVIIVGKPPKPVILENKWQGYHIE